MEEYLQRRLCSLNRSVEKEKFCWGWFDHLQALYGSVSRTVELQNG